jgi:hypothetical protein
MTEISVVAQDILASRQRGMPADEGKLWETLRLDAERAAMGEEMLRGFLDLAVLRHDGFASALSLLLARKFAEYSMPAEPLGEIARSAMAGDPGIITAAIADLVAIRTRDPAAENYLRPFLYYKGFHALQWHRIGHRCGVMVGESLHIFYKAACPRFLPSISIPPCLSGVACLSTTVPVSLSARLRSSATTFQFCTR